MNQLLEKRENGGEAVLSPPLAPTHLLHDASAVGWGTLAQGVFAVMLFSLTMPTMRIAVRDLDPAVVGVGRLLVGAPVALVVLLCLGVPRLTWGQLARLGLVTVCLVFGFAWLVAKALKSVPSYHAAIVIGCIPLSTAAVATLRSGRRQSALFWLASLGGTLVVVCYGVGKSGWVVSQADLLLLAAAMLCGVGYAEGARLGAEVGTQRLACLMPLLAAPVAVWFCWGKWPAQWSAVHASAWAALLYNGWVSAFGAFFFWYRALHKGGTARIGQLQLAQPFFSLAGAALLLHETMDLGDWLSAGAVLVFVALAQRAGRRSA